EDTIDLNELLIARPAASFIMRISGQSMEDAGILDGDYVIVDRSLTPRPGQIVIAALHGDLTIKYLHKYNGRFWLSPANCSYPEIELTKDDPVEIWGVVTGVFRRIPHIT
ncbi:MAG: peptidase S24, partial [Phototrophicales bacterium]